ncbi:hypothetical protein K4M64_004526 [Salmonella enterica]|nr:hypothetical protein [Salmonella enterica]
MKNYHIISIAIIAGAIAGLSVPAHADTTDLAVGCTQFINGKPMLNQSGLVIQIKKDSQGYAYAQVNQITEKGIGETKTYFLGNYKDGNDPKLFFSTRQNPEDRQYPADFMTITGRGSFIQADLVRLKHGKKIGRSTHYFCTEKQ